MPPRDERERSNSKSSPARSSPHYRRRSTPRGSSRSSFQSSKDERRSNDRSPLHHIGPEKSSPLPSNSSPKIPSGPRGLNARSPIIQEKALGSDSLAESVPGQIKPPSMKPPAPKKTMEFAAQDPVSAKSPNASTLKEEVVACLNEFTNQVTENVVLAFQREKAKKFYDLKKENYEKTKSHHTSNPPILEHQNKNLDLARISLENVEGKLAGKKAEMMKTKEFLAIRIVSGGVDTSTTNKDLQKMQSQLNELGKRFEMQSEELTKAKETIYTMNRHIQNDAELFKRQLSSAENELAAMRTSATNDRAIHMKLENQTYAASNLASRLDADVVNLREELVNTRTSLQQDLDPLRSLGQRVGQVDRDIKLAKEELKQVKEESKVKDQETKRRDFQWEQDHKQLFAHETSYKKLTETQQQHDKRLHSIDDYTMELRKKLNALEQAATKLQTVDNNPRLSTARGTVDHGDANLVAELFSTVEGIKNDFQEVQTNLSERFKKFTDDNDDIYATTLDDLNNQVKLLNTKVSSLATKMETVAARVSSLEGNLESLKERHTQDIQAFAANQASQWAQQGNRLQELHKEVQTLKAAFRPTELPSNYPQNQTGFARQTNSPVVSNVPIQGRQSGSPAVTTLDPALISNKIEALEMSILHLNSRYNSLTTEALSRQMWSQLDNVHPHLKDATKGLPTLEHGLQTHDGALSRLNKRVETLEQRPPVFPEGLKEALEKVDLNVTTLGIRADNAQATTQSLQNQIDQVREDLTVARDATLNLPGKSNGVVKGNGSSSDNGLGKRKAVVDTTNGNLNSNSNSKRFKPSRRTIYDTDDELEDQSNAASDALSPAPK